MSSLPPAAEPTYGTAAVVALKAGETVKSRLVALPEDVRRQLAWAMAVDTLTALAAAVDVIVVVSDRPSLTTQLADAGLPIEVVPERGSAGLNRALALGDEVLRSRGWRTVLACVGDLPALTPASVTGFLSSAGQRGREFVPDRPGSGTTMLLARDVALDPRFGEGSALAHHASAARARPDLALDARSDVDTMDDLASVITLGVGDRTATLVARSPEIRRLVDRPSR